MRISRLSLVVLAALAGFQHTQLHASAAADTARYSTVRGGQIVGSSFIWRGPEGERVYSADAGSFLVRWRVDGQGVPISFVSSFRRPDGTTTEEHFEVENGRGRWRTVGGPTPGTGEFPVVPSAMYRPGFGI